jgi:hypothetical protein
VDANDGQQITRFQDRGGPAVSDELTAEQIFNRPPTPVPWPSPRPTLTLLLEALPDVADDIDADLLEQAAMTIADLTEELRAVRMVLSETLAQSHGQQREIARLEQRLAALHELRRSDRSIAA